MRIQGYSFQLAIAGVLVVADQVTKLLIRRSLELYDTTVVIPNLLSLTRIHNTGAAFGLLDGADLPFQTGLLTLVSTAALAGLMMFAASLPEIHRLARLGVFDGAGHGPRRSLRKRDPSAEQGESERTPQRPPYQTHFSSHVVPPAIGFGTRPGPRKANRGASGHLRAPFESNNMPWTAALSTTPVRSTTAATRCARWAR